MKTLAAKDGLTGLANRRAFDQALETEWLRAQRTRKPLALLFVDVDHFKLFNDRHGHQSGDECLRAVASIVGAEALRPTRPRRALWRRGIRHHPSRNRL